MYWYLLLESLFLASTRAESSWDRQFDGSRCFPLSKWQREREPLRNDSKSGNSATS